MTVTGDLSELETYLDNIQRRVENIDVEPGSTDMAERETALHNIRLAKKLL